MTRATPAITPDHPSDAAATDLAVLELRQYTLQPGVRARFAELFDRELTRPQEDVGIRVVGQFLDLDRPDVFVWIRGFPSMADRARALHEFYYGPVWARFRATANPMMLDSDDVLLLQPFGPGPFADDRAPAGSVEVDVWDLAPDAASGLLEQYQHTVAPALRAAGARPLAALRTLHAVNTFAALPVREGSFAVAVTAFRSPADAAAIRARTDAAEPGTPAARRLRLIPTAGSALRGEVAQ